MADDLEDPAEAGCPLSSSSPSKRIEDPASLPGGRAPRSGALGSARRRFTPEERAALLAELEASGESVERFALARDLVPATLHKWRYKERDAQGHAAKPHRVFSPEERRTALEAWSKSGLTAIAFAKLWGVSSESLRAWRRSYEDGGPQALEPRRRGRPPGEGRSTLPAPLQAEIVRTKKRFPTFGLKKVRDFLKRFGGKSVSTGSVRKVLAAEGLHQPIQPVRRRKREIIRRFERSKPGELWQTDITSYVLTRSRVRVYLTVFLDDYSRYVVSWSLATHQRSALVCEALMEGIERFGKPEEVLSDQGRQYFAWRGKSDFQRLLVREGIRHVVSRTHHPETLGKCERLWETIGTELWQRTQPQDLGEARARLAHYFAHYNHFRPHQGIGGYVPADRFFGAERTVRLALEERMARDELAEALSQTPRKGVYVFGQVGDQSVSLHGERGRIVLVTSEGVHKELALEDLGLPQKEKDDDERIDDGRDDGSAARATREEAAGLPAAEAGAGIRAVPLGVGEHGGEDARARDVRGDPLDVAGALDARAGGERALAAAAAGLAVEPGGSVWDARGPLEAAPGPGQGDRDGSEQRGRSEGSAQAHRGAGEGERVPAPAHGGAEEHAQRPAAAPAASPDQTGDEGTWEEARSDRGTASS